MDTQQTAVEWLFEELVKTPKDRSAWFTIFGKALEIEKEQIISAYNKSVPFKFGRQYYDETYKKI